ncbi:SCO family protein [Pyrobaculum ferrireducens]|uniref:SenC-like protein n=1 Tax=Pyrobaculum ferrireducens TaxID=1104324 RepID=G7VI97_9CREN|nr:SCO family protein [Pyrobaculum ferrireducens]AET32189.1 senC-like protein [Pyrobaculum ferrireducens]
MRSVLLITAVLIIVIIVLINLMSRAENLPVAIYGEGGPPAPTFQLYDQYGRAADLRNLSKYILLTFSYTGCPDVGYITVVRINQTLQKYPQLLSKLEVWVVTVSPDTDTADRAREYTEKLGLPFRWLIGPRDGVERAWRSYNITVRYDPKAQYIAHDVRVYLITPTGRIMARIDGVPSNDALVKVLSLLGVK